MRHHSGLSTGRAHSRILENMFDAPVAKANWWILRIPQCLEAWTYGVQNKWPHRVALTDDGLARQIGQLWLKTGGGVDDAFRLFKFWMWCPRKSEKWEVIRGKRTRRPVRLFIEVIPFSLSSSIVNSSSLCRKRSASSSRRATSSSHPTPRILSSSSSSSVSPRWNADCSRCCPEIGD